MKEGTKPAELLTGEKRCSACTECVLHTARTGSTYKRPWNSYINHVKIQLTAGKYSILCQICENNRDSKLYTSPAPEEGKYGEIIMRKRGRPGLQTRRVCNVSRLVSTAGFRKAEIILECDSREFLISLSLTATI